MGAQQRLQRLLDANRVIFGELSLPMVLRRIVEVARDLIGAESCALGVIGADGLLEQFVHVGMDEATVRSIGELPKGRGLLGAVIKTREALAQWGGQQPHQSGSATPCCGRRSAGMGSRAERPGTGRLVDPDLHDSCCSPPGNDDHDRPCTPCSRWRGEIVGAAARHGALAASRMRRSAPAMMSRT
jgi:hypothetical protein